MVDQGGKSGRRSRTERDIERLTLGVALIAVAVAMLHLLPAEFDGAGALALGLVLLASAFYQRSHHWPVGRLTWLVGTATATLGAANLVVGLLPHTATAAAVLLVGLWLTGRGLGAEL